MPSYNTAKLLLRNVFTNQSFDTQIDPIEYSYSVVHISQLNEILDPTNKQRAVAENQANL